MDDNRIERLEIRVAYLEHTLDSLNQTVLDLDRARRELAAECARLQARVGELSDREPPPVQDERPPHY